MSKFPEKILSFSLSSENKTCSHRFVPLNPVAIRAMSRDQDSRDTSKETYQDLISHALIAVVLYTKFIFNVVLKLLHVSATNCSHIQLIMSLSTHRLLRNLSVVNYELCTCDVH